MKIEKFEDIQAWQRAPELVKEIYAVNNNGVFSLRILDCGIRFAVLKCLLCLMLLRFLQERQIRSVSHHIQNDR